jgi:hypothetical protein
MREFFKHTRFQPPSRALIARCNGIIDDYMSQGYRLTLRQLYYQLVSANVIPNKERAYKNLGSLVSNARLAGEMDWEAIEDRVRQPVVWSDHESISAAVTEAMNYYRLPRLRGQVDYIELWVEKDALAGVLRPIASRYHVTLMVNRGYSSQSAMYEAAERLDLMKESNGCDYASVLYLGDLDPSGEDMVRDIKDRLNMFSKDWIDVKKLALTMDQVQEHGPPPNPTKLTDSRAKEFVQKFGHDSWEVDALPPDELESIIVAELENRMDMALVDEIKEREKRDKGRLKELLCQMESE